LQFIKEKYTEELGQSNISLIEDYFSVEHFFFHFDSSGDYNLEKTAIIDSGFYSPYSSFYLNR